MFPHERSLVKRLEDKPFALIGVNSDSDLEEANRKSEEAGITWRSFWCGPEGTGGAIPTNFQVRGWPTLYVIDHEGVIRHKYVGNPGDKKLDEVIDALVEEATKASE